MSECEVNIYYGNPFSTMKVIMARVPCVNETVLISGDNFFVNSVQWDIDDFGVCKPIVFLKSI